MTDGFCQCGCGETVNRRFVRGHNRVLLDQPHIENDNGCWIWQRAKLRGYGRMQWRGKVCAAHRVYYERENGPIPEGTELDHLCQNRACVNPDHLEAVTHAENVQRGGRAKITPTIARQIRASARSPKILAERYGVLPESVRNVLRGKTWKEA